MNNKGLIILIVVIGFVSGAVLTSGIFHAQPKVEDPALGVCHQLDQYPLTSNERVKLDQYIKENYGVECP